jgi:gluconolactonase
LTAINLRAFILEGPVVQDGKRIYAQYSGNVVSVWDRSTNRRHEFQSAGTPNIAFSADGKTMCVMAVDNESGAPYEGRVLATPLP